MKKYSDHRPFIEEFTFAGFHAPPHIKHPTASLHLSEYDYYARFCGIVLTFLQNRPELMIEVKRSNPNSGRGLLRFHNRYAIPGMQLVMHLKREKQD
ncbi:MAG: hypothetical protein ACQEQ7_09085 [Thermodesulfobacteriota bacterium]